MTSDATVWSGRSDAIYRDALVWDMTLPWVPGYADDRLLPRFHAAGIDHVSLTVAADTLGPEVALQQIASVQAVCARAPDEYTLVADVADIITAKEAGKLALSLNLQGTNGLGGKLGMVEVFYRLGIRAMLLAYNQKNLVGDGCAERTDAGLSRFGIRVIEEMNRVGMLVDGTHAGYKTTMEAMEMTSAPFIFSHSNADAVFAHYRNIKDDQIRACARTGGVIGVNGLGAFLSDIAAKTQSMFLHVDHIAQLVGPQHVGIGLDFVLDPPGFWDWVRANPEAWPLNNDTPHIETKFVQPEQLAELPELMLRRGYSDEDVRGVLGANFLRVARQVWK
jgi:membrane dipeptidase